VVQPGASRRARPALEAAALRAALRAHGRPERTFLALNVSTGALLSSEVRAALPDDLSGIVIELTEHELFFTEAALDLELELLRERGARIALDDAGNGDAGLQQMIRIAPDILKLDRSLVDGVHGDPHRFALLDALISFASTTRAAVCAEGVETLGDLVARLARVGSVEDVRVAAAMIPAVLGGDDAAVSRVVPGEHCLEDISRHGFSQPGERYDLSDYPATEYVLRTRTAGQVVAGDPASDPSEVALLERSGFQAVLLVPLVFGGRDVGLLELYRRHAIPWNSGEIERAQLLAHQLGAVIDHLAAAPHDRAAR